LSNGTIVIKPYEYDLEVVFDIMSILDLLLENSKKLNEMLFCDIVDDKDMNLGE
jgi:hypothetical protein